MHGFDSPWVEEQRRYLHALRLSALECVAAVGLGLDGPELASTERSARELIRQEPFRETGYRLLMQALARRDNIAEALRVYEDFRCLLRDELGVALAAATQELHKTLLATNSAGAH
ncbi:MAG TPA: bacterial transcriptional activator domain-containing protein [Gaiellaceae bacterium]|nr:bacterial transcriptional activator domain-containing protein [Gaiellaceae bacterium]